MRLRQATGVLVVSATFMVTGCADEAATESTAEIEQAEAVVAPPSTVDVGGASSSPSVPRVIGMDLQDAQDHLQEVGYDHMESIDYTGRGRNQVMDRNWVVVDQDPPPGSDYGPAYEITMFVVKDDEL